ncbi:hypothetical protein MG293_019333 [Ovis ammon polii]|uniref:Uncharacterized protein n=1 Tax=Ovis ammon polii TaxID=230172 RepID=A0AAD4TQA5_OVIAM|nr:hypothetical protein MG293_019333 [Ovis ammon polii]
MQHDEEPGREGGGSCQRAMPTAVEAESSLTSTPRHRNVQKGKRKRTVLSKSLRNEWSTQSPLPYDFNASYDTTRLGDTMVLWNVCSPCPNLKVATLCQTDKQVTRVILKGKSDERKQGGKWRAPKKVMTDVTLQSSQQTGFNSLQISSTCSTIDAQGFRNLHLYRFHLEGTETQIRPFKTHRVRSSFTTVRLRNFMEEETDQKHFAKTLGENDLAWVPQLQGRELGLNSSNKAIAQLPWVTKWRNFLLAPRYQRKRHWESVHRTSVKRRASHFLSPLSAQQQPGRLEDHSRAWNRSDFGYFRLTNTNNPALKQPEL